MFFMLEFIVVQINHVLNGIFSSPITANGLIAIAFKCYTSICFLLFHTSSFVIDGMINILSQYLYNNRMYILIVGI